MGTRNQPKNGVFSKDKFSMGFTLGVYRDVFWRIYGNRYLMNVSVSQHLFVGLLHFKYHQFGRKMTKKTCTTFVQIISLWVLVIRTVTNVAFFSMRVKLPNSNIGQTTCKMVNLPLCTVMNPFKDLSRFWCR